MNVWQHMRLQHQYVYAAISVYTTMYVCNITIIKYLYVIGLYKIFLRVRRCFASEECNRRLLPEFILKHAGKLFRVFSSNLNQLNLLR